MEKDQQNKSLSCEQLIVYPFIGFTFGCVFLLMLFGFEQWRVHESMRPFIAEEDKNFIVILDGKEENLPIKLNSHYVEITDPSLDEMRFTIEMLKQLISSHEK